MTARRLVLPALVIAVGLVWIAQGVGLLRGRSFMVDDVRWAAIGLVLVVAGAVLLVGRRRRDR